MQALGPASSPFLYSRDAFLNLHGLQRKPILLGEFPIGGLDAVTDLGGHAEPAMSLDAAYAPPDAARLYHPRTTATCGKCMQEVSKRSCKQPCT